MASIATPELALILDLARSLAQAFVWATFLYTLPGLALLRLFYDNTSLTLSERIGLSFGVGVCLYPLLYLWAEALGISVSIWIAWVPGMLALLYWLWQLVLHRSVYYPFDERPGWAWPVVIVLAVLLSRFLPVQTMTAPAWGDSVHHTLIVQLMRENGGLFQSWSPYAPIQSFTYHFGFHANMAVWATVTRQTSTDAVISGGQLFNVLAVLAIYPLAVRLGGSRLAGAAAVLVAGFMSIQPGMYVNWGRYTQLAAQVILPVWLWVLDVWWTEEKRPSPRFLALAVLLAGGLALTHYRVTIVAACLALAWAFWSLWLLRTQWRDWATRLVWIVVAGIASLALVLPWLIIVRAGRLAYVVGAIAQRSATPAVFRAELDVWRNINAYYEPWLWLTSIAALAAALWKRPRLAMPWVIGLGLAFIAANPFLVGVNGTGILTNFLLQIALYIPMSLLCGWLVAEFWLIAAPHRPARLAIAIASALLLASGLRQQITIIDPFYQMVTPADIQSMAWIKRNVPADSRFLVNAFPAYNDTVVVGSDAGWWLPYYTQRTTSLPPILYSTERLAPGVDRQSIRQIVFDIRSNVRETGGDAGALRALLCDYDITHIYLGDRQGEVGFGDTRLIEPEWLQENADFALLNRAAEAQVWSFDRSGCQQPR